MLIQTHAAVWLYTYKVCPESIQPHTMKNRGICWRRYKIQETLYIGQWCLSPLQSRHLGTSHSSPSRHHQLAAPSYFPESHWQSEISPLSRVILVLKKGRSRRPPNLGCRGTESFGWLDVLPKNSEVWCKSGCSWGSCPSPVAHSCGLLNHLNSFRGGMFKLNAEFDRVSLLYLFSRFECDSHTAHMLTPMVSTAPTV